MKEFFKFIVMVLVCAIVTRNIFIGVGLTIAFMIFTELIKNKKEN
jgi:hypothetical protein